MEFPEGGGLEVIIKSGGGISSASWGEWFKTHSLLEGFLRTNIGGGQNSDIS